MISETFLPIFIELSLDTVGEPMNDPAASGGVSRELFLFAASSGELNPKEIKKNDSFNQPFSMVHFIHRLFSDGYVQPGVSPVCAHFRMYHILIYGSEFIRQKGIQNGNYFFISFHRCSFYLVRIMQIEFPV